MLKKEKIILFLIFLLAVFLRFYRLGSIPPVFNRDEAAIGYNAYTILTEGKDEFGEKYPSTFKSFGDYKMPLYIYLVVPCLKIFGVNEFSVRFPSALFGSLTVLIIYFLVKEISKNNLTALISALLLAIAPFHFHYSRLAFEANVALFLYFSGILFFLRGLKKPRLWIVSSLFFTLSLFCYFSPYFLVLPTVVFLIFLSLKEIKKERKYLPLSVFIILTVLGFFVALNFTILANKAKTNITIFKDRLIWEEMAKSRKEHGTNDKLLVKLYDNKYDFYGKKFLSNYFLTFNADFLFFKGGKHPWHVVPQIGNLYLTDFIFLLLGLYSILVKKKTKDSFFLFLFLLTPVVSAVTTDAPHTTRLLNFFVVHLILSVYGVGYLIENFKYRKVLIILIFLVYLYSFGFLLQAYLVHFPKNINPLWFPEIKEKVNYAIKNEDKYQQVIVNDNGESYIYFLFYKKYPLEDYLRTVKLKEDSQGFVHILGFDKYEFRAVNKGDLENKGLLIINPY